MRPIFIACLALLISAPVLAGKCGPEPINPITDIAWQCIFPIRIGGTLQVKANAPDDPDMINSPICTCMMGPVPNVGMTVSFWEPARIIDTVSDPFCFLPLGAKLPNPTPGQLGGGLQRTPDQQSVRAFAQMHYYIFPAWAVLDMFVDLPCVEKKEFDVAMITEVLPTWNDEVMALMMNPEAILFSNPATQLACMADSVAATLGMPRDELFWCMGSWGGSYPLAGAITGSEYVAANAGLAARGIYTMARTGLLLDHAENMCGAVPTPIWRKRHWRLQEMKPVVDNSCHVIGEPGVLWTQGKNPPKGGDNFSWMVFRKTNCCVFY